MFEISLTAGNGTNKHGSNRILRLHASRKSEWTGEFYITYYTHYKVILFMARTLLLDSCYQLEDTLSEHTQEPLIKDLRQFRRMKIRDIAADNAKESVNQELKITLRG